MSLLQNIAGGLRGLFRKEELEQEMDEELRGYLDACVKAKVAGGMNPDAARRAARQEIGGLEAVKESTRAAGWEYIVETIWQDLRFGVRMLRKSPGFTIVAVLTLALGIGANTAIFTVAYATLFAPLPYPQPNRLVNVWSKIQGHRNPVSVGDFIDWKRQSAAFEDLNAWGESDFNIASQDSPEDIVGIYATQGFERMLGSPLFLGRDFLPEEGESGKEHVVILTNRLWRHLGANPKIIGQPMQIKGEPYVVVGVLAPGAADRWQWEMIVPLVFTPDQLTNHDSRYSFVTGRLKPGVTIKQAQAEMDSVTADESRNYPKSNQGWGALVEPFKNDFLPRDRQVTIWLLLGAVGFLLLIACVNVANLLLAKGITRQREVAIRSSLGARPTAIFAQFLTESLVLATLGGLFGIALGYTMLRGLVAVMPPLTLPAEADVRLNLPILFIMLATATLAGLLFGSTPAWFASRADPAATLKDGGHSGTGAGHHRLRRILVIGEFALALPLLAGAGLAIRSFWNLTHVDLGIRTDHILGFYLIPLRTPKGPAQIDSYYRRILASIKAVPGVLHACAMSYLPPDTLHAEMHFSIADQPAYANPSVRPNADLQMVTPDYFQTFGIRLVKGREFSDADSESGLRVAMVNEVFASRFLKGVDPLKQRVVMEQVTGGPQNGPAVEWQIVGVFHTVKSRGAREDNPEIDTPFWQEAFPLSGIGVRTAEDPATMIKSVAAAVKAVDSQAALYDPRTMEQMHDEVLANDRFTAILFASFAVVGLLLAAVGIHGVTAFSLTQRSHEIALRMALGASRSRVVTLLVKEGLVLACIGLGFGLIGAYFVGREMQSTLFGVGAIDFPTVNALGLVLLFVALLACYIPARRATRVDPMVVLRHE